MYTRYVENIAEKNSDTSKYDKKYSKLLSLIKINYLRLPCYRFYLIYLWPQGPTNFTFASFFFFIPRTKILAARETISKMQIVKLSRARWLIFSPKTQSLNRPLCKKRKMYDRLLCSFFHLQYLHPNFSKPEGLGREKFNRRNEKSLVSAKKKISLTKNDPPASLRSSSSFSSSYLNTFWEIKTWHKTRYI